MSGIYSVCSKLEKSIKSVSQHYSHNLCTQANQAKKNSTGNVNRGLT